jgi:transposase
MSLSTKVKMSLLSKGQEMDKLLQMSTKELSRLEVMQRLSQKKLNQKEAGRILKLSRRQIKRLLKAFREQGAAGLVSKRRGRKANNRLSEEVKRKALNLLKTKYEGFGPTLAHEKLVEKEKLQLSDESVRKLMIEEGLWKARKAKKVVVHQLRERRACFGELVQIDGSPHDWFEGRAEACVLLAFIDDATGKLVQLLFVDSESFFSYCQAAEGYFRHYGKPVAFYSDKNSIFRVNVPSAGSQPDLTQFGRAMLELDIEIICANTPQAKGRVERVIQTLQDRLPKEMRLRGLDSMAEGNAYLPEFIQNFNARFGEEPRSNVDLHRPLIAKEDLAHILTWQETRTLSKNLTLQFDKIVYQIQTQRPSYALRNACVTVCVNAQEQITILYNGQSLPYTIYQQQAKQATVVSTKQLDLTLKQKRLPPKPAPDHPWRQGFATPLSKRGIVTSKGDISALENR